MTASQPFTISTWKWLLGLSVFFLALLISVPSFARIMVTPENPGQGDTASGVTAISGWAYSTEGADVTVKLRVNGKYAKQSHAVVHVRMSKLFTRTPHRKPAMGCYSTMGGCRPVYIRSA